MRTLILSFVLLAVPTAASAQVCPYGLVAVDAAHCCWPGQAFAPDRGTCAGVPQCPPGLAPYGETCIASGAAAQPQAQPAGQPLPPPPPPPPPAAYQPMPQQVPMQMPQVFGYPVRFEAKKEGHEFTVSVDNGISCRTPCDLTVPPGRHHVKVEGDARFEEHLNFPASPTTVQIERRGAIRALGIVGLAVGIPAAAIGGVFGMLGWIANESYSNSSNRNVMYGGLGVMAAGVTLAAVAGGVGFGLAGHNKAKFARADADEPGEAPPVQLLSLGAVPTNGGGMVGATFAF
ncbi:MAG TPA: hypothetical protein VGK67_13690 [Myxococcales bacterium]|jgi:hypothetical protein